MRHGGSTRRSAHSVARPRKPYSVFLTSRCEFPIIGVTLFWGPYNKDPYYLGYYISDVFGAVARPRIFELVSELLKRTRAWFPDVGAHCSQSSNSDGKHANIRAAAAAVELEASSLPSSPLPFFMKWCRFQSLISSELDLAGRLLYPGRSSRKKSIF